MAELTSLDLLLAAAGVGVAVWTDVIGSAEERIDSFENKHARNATRLMIFLSATILLMVFGSFGAGLFVAVTSNSLGVGGIALFLVIMSIALAGIPTITKIYVDIIKHNNRLEGLEEIAASLLVTAVISGSAVGLVYVVTR